MLNLYIEADVLIIRENYDDMYLHERFRHSLRLSLTCQGYNPKGLLCQNGYARCRSANISIGSRFPTVLLSSGRGLMQDM